VQLIAGPLRQARQQWVQHNPGSIMTAQRPRGPADHLRVSYSVHISVSDPNPSGHRLSGKKYRQASFSAIDMSATCRGWGEDGAGARRSAICCSVSRSHWRGSSCPPN
jgi:hypothetical protein